MTKFRIIINPTAGRGNAGKHVPKIKKYFSREKALFDIALTTTPWHAANLAQQAVVCGYDRVIAGGGDGTANEVLNGLLIARDYDLGESKFGVIPVGRGNDFAYSMGAPDKWQPASEAILDGYSRPVDIGRVWGGLYPEGRYFGNGVGIGFDAVVGFESQKLKQLRGFLSYIVAAIRTIALYYNSPMLEIELDGKCIQQPALMVSVMNGVRLGGGFMMAPTSQVDDGLFNICVAGKVSRPEMLRLIFLFIKGQQADHPAIKNYQASKVRVTALEGNLPAHTDGETLSTQATEIKMELRPKQIELLVKKPDETSTRPG